MLFLGKGIFKGLSCFMVSHGGQVLRQSSLSSRDAITHQSEGELSMDCCCCYFLICVWEAKKKYDAMAHLDFFPDVKKELVHGWHLTTLLHSHFVPVFQNGGGDCWAFFMYLFFPPEVDYS